MYSFAIACGMCMDSLLLFLHLNLFLLLQVENSDSHITFVVECDVNFQYLALGVNHSKLQVEFVKVDLLFIYSKKYFKSNQRLSD